MIRYASCCTYLGAISSLLARVVPVRVLILPLFTEVGSIYF